MPATRIELKKKGLQKESLLKVRDLVLDTIIEVLKLPETDRNIRIIEYEPEYFMMKPPYEILIEISMFSGRTKETKKKLFQCITRILESNGLVQKEQVMIIINEQPMENWGVRGDMPADEINMGFKINI